MRAWHCRTAFSSSLAAFIFGGPSSSQFTNLIQLCTDFNGLNLAKLTHQQIAVHGLHKDPYFTTKLVQYYSDCGDIASARVLFDELPLPNVFAWTAVIAFYSRHSMFGECARAFGGMKRMGVSPDQYVFPKVLRACAQSSSLKFGVQVHKDVILYGVECNVLVCNSLVDMYSKCWDVESARRVFDATAERDLLSWNSIIFAHVYNECYSMALQLWSLMRLDGLEPDIVTWNTVIDTYCRIGECDEAWKTFEQIKEPNIISWTTLIRGYLRTGNHEATVGTFKEMVNRRKASPDVDCLSSVLVSCKHLEELVCGREIHAYGMKSTVSGIFYKSVGPVLVTMYARCRRIQDAKTVFDLMDKSDVVTWNAMIQGFAHLGMGNSALECFRNMQIRGVQNDETTLSVVLPVCDLKSGKQIHAHVRKSSLSSAIFVCNALISMYSKCGCIPAAYAVFSGMESRDCVSWNTMIGSFGIHGFGEASLRLLQEMCDLGFMPSPSTFTSVLSACSHSGLISEGLEIFHRMTTEYGFDLGIQHYACVVDLLTRAGHLEDAVAFIKTMPLQPNKHVWGAVLAASLAHQNTSFAILASENLVHLEPENAGHYISLSNIYAKAERWEDAVRVRKLMESTSLEKPSGLSLIEG